jgi:lysophospholipase
VGRGTLRKEFTQPDQWQSGTLVNRAGENLRYGFIARHAHPLKNIIIAAGLSEFQQKYFEAARNFDDLGYNVYIMDWYGQGASDRYFKNDPSKRHSHGFLADSNDLLLFKEKIVRNNAPCVLLSHSMGALPSLLAIISHPKLFSGLAMSAPFLGIQHPLLRGREFFLSKIPAIPHTKKFLESYIPGGGPWRPRTDSSKKVMPEDYSSDPERNKLHDTWMQSNPNLRLGDVTWSFIREAAITQTALRQDSVLESINLPVLIFSAGQEKIVSNKEIFKAAARFPNVWHAHIPNASHEILQERDAIRDPILLKIHNFFKSCP